MEVACPKCRKRYKIAESAAGKKVRCADPQCGTVFVVPTPASAPTPPAGVAPAQPTAPASPRPPASPAAPDPRPAAPAAASSAPIVPPVPLTSSPSLFDDLMAAEQTMGPPASGALPSLAAMPRRGKPKNLLLYAGLAAGGVVLLVVIVAISFALKGGSGAGSGGNLDEVHGALSSVKGPLGSASWCIPANAKAIASVNVEKLRRSDVFRLLKTLAAMGSSGTMPGMPGAMPGMTPPMPFTVEQMTASFESIVEVRVAVTQAGNPIAVVRTTADMPLEQAAATGLGMQPQLAGTPPATPAQPKTASGVSYLAAPSGDRFVAKLGPNAFCTALQEKDLEEALARLQRSEVVPLSDPLRRAWETAKGDILVAVHQPEPMRPVGAGGSKAGPNPVHPTPTPPEWIGVGITTDTNLAIQGTVSFPSEADAKSVTSGIANGIQTLEKQASMIETQFSRVPPAMQNRMAPEKDMVQKLIRLVRALRVSQRGTSVQFSGTWAVRDVEDFINQVQQSLKKSPTPPGLIPRKS